MDMEDAPTNPRVYRQNEVAHRTDAAKIRC
jgi:hypothetical protein